MFIRIHGQAGEGKNTLGILIGKLLHENGFTDVQFVDYEGAGMFQQATLIKQNDPIVQDIRKKRIVIDTINHDEATARRDHLSNPLEGDTRYEDRSNVRYHFTENF